MSATPEPRIGPRHLIAPAIAYAVCAGVVLVLGGVERGAEACAVIFGPYAGGMARDWQSCCAEFSFQLAPYALVSVAVGISVQLLVPPTRRAFVILRKSVWIAASALWFLLALLSYAHALE